MKVLMLNGSPHAQGTTALALQTMKDIFMDEGIEVEIIQVGSRDVRGCMACGACGKLGKCVYDDIVNEIAAKFEEADGLVLGSPVYYASANATLVAVLDRLFYSSHFDKTMKVGASVMKQLARNMAFLMKAIALGKEHLGMPVKEKRAWTNFIR